MIRFTCPRCRTEYSAPYDSAGQQTGCAHCDATVIIPEKTLREIVYGIELPDEPETNLSPRQTVYPIRKTTDVPTINSIEKIFSFDDEPIPESRRRSRRKSSESGTPIRRYRRSGMANAVAFLHFLSGLLAFLCGSTLLLAGAGVLLSERINGLAVGVVSSAIAVIVLCLAIPDLVVAYGIWNRRYWGRTCGVIMACLNGLFAIASIFWGDVCSLTIDGFCSIFSLVILLNPRYSGEFS